MAFLLRHGRWGVACPRFVRAYAQRVAQYRPLPDPSVAWRADEAEAVSYTHLTLPTICSV